MRLIDADAFKKILSEKEMQHDKRRSFDEYSYGAAGAYEYAGDLLDEQPTVELPHGVWIPVEERLPEDDKEVLVYVRRKDVEKSEMNGLHIARKHRMEGDPEGNNNFWGVPVAPCEWRIEGWSYFFEPEVLAWMPLPEPYKKEGET